jgi:hypothetical protein
MSIGKFLKLEKVLLGRTWRIESKGAIFTSSNSTECFWYPPRFRLAAWCLRICTRISSAFRFAAAKRSFLASMVGLRVIISREEEEKNGGGKGGLLWDGNFDGSVVVSVRDYAWYSGFVECCFDVFDALCENVNKGKERKRAQHTCSLKSVINNVEPSLTPTVASSSSLTPSGLSGVRTLTGASKAGVTRPSARLSAAAQSLRKNSAAACIAPEHLAYSSRAAGRVRGDWEPGMKEAVDLSLGGLEA